ncbi:MAG TPA: ATP synthase F1 subunit epsilon [Bacteroides sp.]|nr:ATP synthase F1 subunit epsilon [Bacteroides sp.]
MKLQIITPDKKVFDGEVKLVQVPGSKGSFQVLNNHAPIISTLENGVIKIIDASDKTSTISINGGVIEVKNNKIIILAEST